MSYPRGNKSFAIDKVSTPPPTTAPVQVLVLGLSRTGTFCSFTLTVKQELRTDTNSQL